MKIISWNVNGLKSILRPIAMMIPDLMLIAEIKFLAEGIF